MIIRPKLLFTVVFVAGFCCSRWNVTAVAEDTPAVAVFHTKTLSFKGPETSESANPNPFTDCRLLVTFEHEAVTYVVRGFFAADGDAADTSAATGDVWNSPSWA